MARIRSGDVVKIITGSKKGTTGKVLSVDTKKNTVFIEGVGVGVRHVRPSQLNPQGGKRDIHVPMDISKVALVVDEKTGKTSRVGLSKNAAGKKVRTARALKDKEIK
ncbi:50S ribosomal protein L24 [Candidatus Nomurabacteria bacterium]|nr:50S ribosomal protein L24 [Candidatus Nomurabacteria bacterium]